MKRRISLLLPAALILGIAFAPPPARAADAQATIDNFTFSPPVLTISPGTRVTWTNRDDIPHTVTDQDHPKETKSPPLDTGDSYSRVFATAGTYHYFCSLHPHMQGTVVVQ
jgi:plastocyanin